MRQRNRFEGGEEEDYDLDNLSDVGSSISNIDKKVFEEDLQFEGGKKSKTKVLSEEFKRYSGIEQSGNTYSRRKDIQDRGFKDWEQSHKSLAGFIRFVALIVNFKFYRLTWSWFLG